MSLTGRAAGKELLGAMNVVDGEEQEIEGAKDKRGSSTSKLVNARLSPGESSTYHDTSVRSPSRWQVSWILRRMILIGPGVLCDSLLPKLPSYKRLSYYGSQAGSTPRSPNVQFVSQAPQA